MANSSGIETMVKQQQEKLRTHDLQKRFPAGGLAAAGRRLLARERNSEISGAVPSSLEEIDESKTTFMVRVHGWCPNN